MWRLGKQAFVGRRKYDSPKNDCVGGYCCLEQLTFETAAKTQPALSI